jgi:hypothetical protein
VNSNYLLSNKKIEGEFTLRKCITTLTVTLFLLCFSVSTGLAQDQAERGINGKKIVEASRILISDGQILEKCTCQDRAKMLEQAEKMLVKGQEILSTGEMMRSDKGRANMQAVAASMLQGGNMLLKKAKQEGEISAKDKAKINKLGKDMIVKGNLLLKKGEMM